MLVKAGPGDGSTKYHASEVAGRQFVLPGALLLAVFFFTADVYLPLGVAGGVPYVAVVLVALWVPQRRFVLESAILCSVLVVAGYFFSPPGGEHWKVLANRFLALFAIWVTAFLGTWFRRAEEALERTKHEAEEASRAKGDFLARMSHEIRTPLNAVIGLGNLVLMTDLTPKQCDYLKKIETSSRSLLGIINDILDFSKIEAGRLTLESIDFQLEEVLANLSAVVTLKAEEKGLELVFSISDAIPIALVGDPLRVGQVLINLVNNAIKFTEKGDILVSIEPERTRNEKGLLRFTITDTGAGMTDEQMGRLFESFSQSDGSISRRFGGTGLGLAICKRLVELMGGEITVESEPGKGSTFSFTAVFGVRKIDTKTLLPPSSLRGVKVLVVDDSALSQRTLREKLEAFSFEVTTVGSGEEALAELLGACAQTEQKSYELVILDYKMSGMDGLALAKKINSNAGISKTPTIIMVTAYGREEVIEEAANAGIKGFLIKPVSPSILFDTIMEIFGRHARLRPQRGNGEGVEHSGLIRLDGVSGARVLLAEDNEINQQVTRELLEKVGFSVEVAPDGKEAVRMVSSAEYDAVLMDVQMPGMDGYEATRLIKQERRNANLPVIAMTAQAMTGDREKCLESGMDDYVAKPIEPEELYATLSKWIREKRGGHAAAPPVGGDGARPPEGAPHRGDEGMPDADLQGLVGIDARIGIRLLGGSTVFFKKLLGDFRDDYDGYTAEISRVLEANDTKGAAMMVHSLKGVAGSIGAHELKEAARRLESGLIEGDERRDALLEVCSRELKTVLGSIERLGRKR